MVLLSSFLMSPFFCSLFFPCRLQPHICLARTLQRCSKSNSKVSSEKNYRERERCLHTARVTRERDSATIDTREEGRRPSILHPLQRHSPQRPSDLSLYKPFRACSVLVTRGGRRGRGALESLACLLFFRRESRGWSCSSPPMRVVDVFF